MNSYKVTIINYDLQGKNEYSCIWAFDELEAIRKAYAMYLEYNEPNPNSIEFWAKKIS